MKLAWLFPGQGAQKVGMGQDVAASSSAARAVFDEADRELGFALSELCFHGPEAELQLTANTQPAILTASCALLAALRERHPELQPEAAAGHSLGEYSALVAAGALSLGDAVRLVRLRGEAMQLATPPGQGAMVAIMGGDAAVVDTLCRDARGDEILSAANFNCPGQVVIAGHAAAAARAMQLAKERKLKAIPLKVSAPFHCALMAPAAKRLADALEGVALGAMSFPVVANIDASPNQDPLGLPERLVRQVDGAVRWQQSVEWLVAQGFTHALEIGPGKVLAGLIRKTSPGLRVLNINDAESLQLVGEFLAE
jgi:[acyl-carrier-protein] S-malonyltransferase